jgi:hypothetical protein
MWTFAARASTPIASAESEASCAPRSRCGPSVVVE